MVYVITGGPGFGKTSIIDLLEKAGFPVCSEGARALMPPESKQMENLDSMQIPTDFERKISFHRIDFLQSIAPETIAFSDRGLPDQIAYSRYKNKIPSSFIEKAVLSNRYAPFVFVTPPWETIFTTDQVRRESYAEATCIHRQIIRAYHEHGYEIIEIPLTSPEMRMKFILNILAI